MLALRHMRLPPDALRWVMAQGAPSVVDVRGGSMTPALRPGERVRVASLASGEHPQIRVGDIVLVVSEDERDLLLHRVVHLFEEAGRRFVVHQGDAARSTFAVCPRELVLGKAVGFEGDPGRVWPSVDALDEPAARLFLRRVRAAALFCGARSVARALGIGEGPIARRLARVYRSVARALFG
jgi:hypothetical protein